MKKILATMLMVFIFSILFIDTVNIQSVYAKEMTTKKTYIKVQLVSVTQKQMKLKITNKGKKDFYFSELYTLKKRINNKWKKVEFKDNAMFAKTRIAEAGKSTMVKIKWKKYFKNNLTKGKYKIKHIRTKVFRIK